MSETRMGLAYCGPEGLLMKKFILIILAVYFLPAWVVALFQMLF